MGSQRGFHYVEVVIATLMLSVAVVPALDALRGGLLGATLPVSSMVDRNALQGKLEDVLAQSLGNLDSAATAAGNATTPTTYSDAAGTSGRRLVYLSRYDADNADGDNNGFTGTDAGLMWVRVELENGGTALETLIGND